MHRAWCGIEEVPYFIFQGHLSIIKVTHDKKLPIFNFLPKFGVSGLKPQFELTDGYEMMHQAWSSIEEMPYCFWRSSIKFQGHTGHKYRWFWSEFGVSGL